MSGEDVDLQAIDSANTMRERTGSTRVRVWFLMSANRFAVTGLLATVVFSVVLAFALFLDPALAAVLRSQDTVEMIFSTMLSVLVTGTTLVVTIAQLIVSEENGPLGDQRQRMSDAMDFRTYASDFFDGPPPATPSIYLKGVAEECADRAADLRGTVDASEGTDLARQVDVLTRSVESNADSASDGLADAQFGTYDVVHAALDFDYSWYVYQLERLTETFSDSLSEDDRESIQRLKQSLAMYGPAREHVKTLYFEWALADLSRYILYVAVPAVGVAGGMLAFVGNDTFEGAALGLPVTTWVVLVAFVFTLVPFLLFASYVFRVAMVAKRTLAIGPLVLRDVDD